MSDTIESDRLIISRLSPHDSDFIFDLVNTAEWIKFIGDRKVYSKERAKTFVQSVIENPNVNYWVVTVREQLLPVGIVSHVKRDFLEFADVGFAFLPSHAKQGYAYEATRAFLQHLAKEKSSPTILATTIKGNSKSIALLTKLGFQFSEQIEREGEELLIYSIALSKFVVE